MTDDRILEIRDLHVQFQTSESLVRAVDGVSLGVRRGHTLGIVGESGSGKSVTALAILGLIPQPPGRIAGGEILFWDQPTPNRAAPRQTPVDLCRLSAEQLRFYRGGRIALISQEPMSALNPVYTCGFQMVEAIRLHQDVSAAEARRRAIALFQEVKLLPSDGELRQRGLDEWAESRRSRPQPVHWDGSPQDGSPQGGSPQDGSPDTTTAPPTLDPAQERQINQFINRQKQAMLDRYPHQLSGGQLQRVAIAMAISCDPTLLIADEPTTALDVTVQARILDLLRELRDRRGMSLIFVTHDLGTIAEIADDVAVMYQGKIVETGSVLEIFAQPQHPYTRGLLTCRPRPDRQLRYLPTVADFLAQGDGLAIQDPHDRPDGSGRSPTSHVISTDPGRSLNDLLTDTISPAERDQRLQTLQAQAPLLQVQDLRVAFPVRGMFGQARRYFMAVNGVSFDVYPGETLGLVGESGCGKSTLARAILRLIEPTSGSIVLDGLDLLAQRGQALRKLRRDMQIVFQDPYSSLDPRMTIGAAVMEPTLVHGAGQSRQVHRDRAAYLLDRVGIDPAWMNRYPHEFSGGQRQRICIARALALNPRFIICDESVSALDVSVQAQVLNLLKALQAEFGLTYIFISHDLSVVKFMSDRILVMNQGKIEELGPADQVYRSPQRDYTRQLIAAIPQDSLEAIRQRQSARSHVA